MNCLVPSGNIKIINRTLHTLAKIGDELYIEAKPDHLQFATINQSKTSYVTFNFNSVFFSTYEVNTRTHYTTDTSSNITCKLYIKALLNIFKIKGPREKNIDWCKIQLEDDPSKLLLQIKYKQDVIVNHSLNLIDMEFIAVAYDRDKMPNQLNTNGPFLTQVLTNFQTSDNDMSWDIKSNKITVRNYDVASNNNGKKIRSQVVLNSNEFASYKIGRESNITMSFKPFRAAIAFSEISPIVINFDIAGKPVILTIKNPIYEATFILSTISPDGFTQSCSDVSQIIGKKVGLSKEDRTMLENLNWDSDFEVDDNDVMLRDPKDVVNENRNKKGEEEMVVEDVIPQSPESPRSKRLKIVFGRCFEATYHGSKLDFGCELAPNSDSE